MKLSGCAGIGHTGCGAELGGRASTNALRLHGSLEAFVINLQLALARNVRGQIHRKPVGVIELKYGLAIKPLEARAQGRLQHFHAVLQGLSETLLLGFEHFCHAIFYLHQFGISLAHGYD